jgi:hypothetical protein
MITGLGHILSAICKLLHLHIQVWGTNNDLLKSMENSWTFFFMQFPIFVPDVTSMEANTGSMLYICQKTAQSIFKK